MKTKLTTVAILLTAGIVLSASIMAQQSPASKPAKASSTSTQKAAAKPAPLVLKTEKDKGSYAIGVSVARSLERDGIEVDPAMLLRGLKDGLADGKLLVTNDEARTAIGTLQREGREKIEAKMKIVGEENKKEGAAFLAANKSKPGVVTLADGLQYKVVKQGDGPKPVATDTVECNYRGTLVNGKEFDSSAQHGDKPATLQVNRVIKGWTEVLQLMPVGSKYQVFIPAELAYGPSPNPGIGPNATLIFDIELVSIQEKPVNAAVPPAPAVAPSAPAPDAAKPAEPAK